MRPIAILALNLVTLGLGAGACVVVAQHAVELVEERAGTALETALADGGFDWVTVEINGLQARLGGEAPDEAERFRALRAAGAVVNPVNLRDGMSVADPDAPPPPEYRFELMRNGATITALGLIPGGNAAKALLLDTLAEIDGVTTVSDLLSSSPDAAPPGWETAMEAGVAVVRGLTDARVELSAETMTVTGLTPDTETKTYLEQGLASQVGDQIALMSDFSVPPPVISPFVTRFRIDDAGARFEACSASSAKGRQQIEAAARNAGAQIDDTTCVVAMGAPDTQWDRVTARGIDALTQIGAGVLTISDLSISITPGAMVQPAQMDRALAAFEADLPDTYTLSVAPVPGAAQTAAATEAVFSATLSPEGQAIVRGTTADRHARDVVETLVAARFPRDKLHISLRQQSGLPEGWSARVLAGLDAFSALETGRLSITPDMLTLKGTTGDPALPGTLASNLTALLGPSMPMLLDIAYVEDLDPVASLPTAEDCLARINDIQANTKITFAPGSTELDIDGLRIVRRIAAVLRECEDVEMEIGGYTDSQGRDEMNTALSQARADAVFNALIAERVRASNLSAIGYGEERPVADNDTAEGREANRRIEFSLRYPLFGPFAPDDDPSDETAQADPDAPATETEQTDGQN
ncbi:OmpA family protein [Fluviibacterium sp. DFM31]|uniref:OmpA family protein n=1 Tax=Meridianimarinicoccus marinus TaxID=3231483 RepID=A0ABV3L6C5_9RHOB